MVFRFNAYTLNAEQRSLRRGAEEVFLTPKVFQTLLVLVENHERVVSKDELCRRIWPDQFVEEANLTQNISVLRRTLDEASSGNKHIVTFHGHGYRFIEPVRTEAVPDVSTATAPPTSAPPTLRASAAESAPEPPDARRRWVAGAIAALLVAVAAIAFAANVYRKSRLRTAPVSFVSPVAADGGAEALTRLRGEQFEPSWSPDGSAFAFVNRVQDATESTVYVQRQDDVQPRAVLAGNYLYNSPTWSPDGRSLAVVRVAPAVQGIVIVDLKTGAQRPLTTLFPHRYGLEYRHLDWSPDGSLLAVDDKVTETDPLSLYLVHVADGTKNRVTYPTMDIIGDVAPRFSPDGTTLAFIRIKYQGQNAVLRVPVAGGEATVVQDPSTLVSDVGWATNASLIFAARLQDSFRFWRVPLHAGSTVPQPASPLASDMPLQFSLRRGKGEVAFSAYSPNLDIWALHLTGTVKWQPVVTTPGQDVAPAISPDGKQVAFRSDFGGREQLWVANLDSTHAHVVDTLDLVPSVHGWDADSRTLLFKGRYRAGLYAVDDANGRPPVLLSAEALSHPARSIDGKTVFARTGRFIFQVRKADGSQELLTNRGGAPIAESSDGRYLYFAQGRMDSSIARFDMKTHEQQVVLTSLIPGYNESWALTAAGIYFLTEQGGKPVIAFHAFRDGREHMVSPFPGDLPPVGDAGFAVTPDGSTLLIVRAESVAGNIERTWLNGLGDHAGPAVR